MIPQLYESPVRPRYGRMQVLPTAPSEEARTAAMRVPMYIAMPDRPVAGELWAINWEMHFTNNTLRAKGVGLFVTSEIRVAADSTQTRNGLQILDASGAYNIGVEAHHGLITRTVTWLWTPERVAQFAALVPDGAPVVKLVIWSGSAGVTRTPYPYVDISQDRGLLQCLRWLP